MSLSYNNTVVVRQSAAFYGTGAVQTFTVPAGVTAIRFFLWGAGGGNQDGSSVIKNGVGGGSGAYMEGNLVVRPGAVYSIIVGKYGVAGLANGGGSTAKYGGPGGGFSGIFSSTPAANTVIAIAGGGGGSGVNGSGVGGGGGYPSGINGTASGAGTGGTQSAGGTGYQSGSQFAGGNGSLGQNGGGGGGGGGWYGGGSGADSTACGGGGGSSTYISSVINVVSINGNLGITTTDSNTPAANSSSPYWQSPYGQSAADGLVVIGYNQTLPAPQLRLSNETVINQTVSFLGTGAVQTWTVPAGVFNVKFFLWGSGGIGQNGVTNVSTAGGGGFVQGNLVTTPGTTYSIIVGRPGLTGLANGGSTTGGTSAGGGGFSGIFSASPAANTVIAIAGAGGGSGFNTGGYGGGGGYPNGLPGVGGQSQGGGGTQLAGGSSTANVGTQLAGGNGGGGDNGGGGGGGGWYGGGGGNGQGAGGGGSSTYTTLVVNPATQNGTTGSQTGTIPTPPGGNTSPYWVSPYGSAGQNGLVVFGYTIGYAPPNSHTYKYVKFTVFLTRGGMSGANPEFQMSEFQLKIGGVFVNYTGITISPNTTGGEGSIRVIDGLVGTKYFAVSQGNSFTIISPSTFTFDSYTWATANDASVRDPVRWRVEGSADNTNWTVLDDKSTVTQTVTETRQVYLPDIQLPSSVPPTYSLSYTVPTETLLQAFTSTGAVQSYTVPANTLRIKMYAWGSGGGNGNGSGGGGGFVSGSLRVIPGQILYIIVGSICAGYPAVALGGGGGKMGKYYGAGGGGFSGVFTNSSPARQNCVCMAGGGGAGNINSAGGPALTGGPGGYPNGFSGSSDVGRTGGGGGTQSGGGAGAGGGNIVGVYSGVELFGGDGTTTLSDGGYGGGWGSGGGGWFGGGASCQNSTNAGGGGGSGFIGGLQQPIQTANGSYSPTTNGTANAGGESNRYWQTPYGRSGQNGYVVLTRFQ